MAAPRTSKMAKTAKALKTDRDVVGPMAWTYGHAVTFTYPEEDPTEEQRTEYRVFLESYASVFPCQQCRTHWADLLSDQLPLTDAALASRASLSAWFVDCHNAVNDRLGKPIRDYEEVAREYLNKAAVARLMAKFRSATSGDDDDEASPPPLPSPSQRNVRRGRHRSSGRSSSGRARWTR